MIRAVTLIAVLVAGPALAEDDLVCPEGSERQEAPSKNPEGEVIPGTETFCLDADGKRHGPVRYWYQSGERLATGTNDHGLATGQWTHYHKNGERLAEGMMEADKPAGLWRKWDSDGKKQSETHFKDGNRHGLDIRWHHQAIQV